MRYKKLVDRTLKKVLNNKKYSLEINWDKYLAVYDEEDNGYLIFEYTKHIYGEEEIQFFVGEEHYRSVGKDVISNYTKETEIVTEYEDISREEFFNKVDEFLKSL